MARPSDSHIEEALRIAGAAPAWNGQGGWRLSLVNGATVSAEARISDGWLELNAPLSSWLRSHRDDVVWLRVNEHLGGSARVVRTLAHGSPLLRVDAHVEDNPDVVGLVLSTCRDLAGAAHAIETWPDRLPPSPFEPGTSRTSAADIEHACAEAGWRCTAMGDGSLRLAIDTRAGAHAARLESSADGERVLVELMDLAGLPATARRAVAALLLAVSGSVRSVKGMLTDRDGAIVAMLAAPVAPPIDRGLDRALSALAVACHFSLREAQALCDERLAADYLALWNAEPQHESHRIGEERTCLQQP